MYIWDEPKEEDYPKIKMLTQLVRSSAPSLKILLTEPFNKLLSSSVDIWVPVMDEFGGKFPGINEYEKLRKERKQTWWYVSCLSHGCDYLSDSGAPDLVVDRSSSYIRVIPWLTMKYGMQAFLYYAATYAYEHYPQIDPWNSLWDFSGNGDGTILYPGRPGMHGLTEHKPIPSIRLKTWREASFDAEYIKWMEDLDNKPEWWIKEFGDIAKDPKIWEKDYSVYQNLKEKAGDYLNNL